mmetsp:Transcript_25232/g.58074  ORF Transcript_25232/g.58074 Transcript_25232/m.58074 type:complete len:1026 (-) Transcript_25232:70-3147(-)
MVLHCARCQLPQSPNLADLSMQTTQLSSGGSFRSRILLLADEFERLEQRCEALELNTAKPVAVDDFGLGSDSMPMEEPPANSIGVVIGQAIVGPNTIRRSSRDHPTGTGSGRLSGPSVTPSLDLGLPFPSANEDGGSSNADVVEKADLYPAEVGGPYDSQADRGSDIQVREVAPGGNEVGYLVHNGHSSRSVGQCVTTAVSEAIVQTRTTTVRHKGRKTTRNGLSKSERGGESPDSYPYKDNSRLRFDRRWLDALPEEDTHKKSEFITRHEQMPEPFSKPKAPRGMLSPVGSARLTWDGWASSVLLVDVWVTLFEVVYMPEHEIVALSIAHWSIVVFFMLDLVLNFCTGYIKEDKIVMDRFKSINRYFHGWFWVDFIATLPLDLLMKGIWDGSGAVSLVRIGKVARVLRTLRFLRMMRSHSSLQRNHGSRQQIFDFLSPCVSLTQLVALSLLLAHIDGCLRGVVQLSIGTLERTTELGSALEQYWDNFLLAFLELAAGDGYETQVVGDDEAAKDANLRLRAFSMFVAAQHLGLLALLALWAVTTGSRYFQQNDAFRTMKSATLSYLQKRKVSLDMQLQIVYFMNQAHKAHVMQARFQNFTSQHLPEEMRRAVCEELWAEKLLSLGLILHVAPWHDDLLNRLTLIVREDVLAAKMVLCREGSPSIAAYHIIKGKFVAMGKFSHFPPFTDGMWVGERALVSTLLHRKMTVMALVMSYTMTVPAEEFHQILAQLELTAQYQDFCVQHLPNGLCGRCGSIGEHMLLGCPTIRKASTHISLPSHQIQWPSFSSFWPHSRSQSVERPFNRAKLRMGTQDISALAVAEGQEIADAAAMDGPQAHEHLLFLSHYKAEAGTEAALIRTEIEHMIEEDRDSLGNYFDSPVFLDSEDLDNLEELQNKVRCSHNLLLLLSKGVLKRPWVLIEICTAVQEGAHILPVQLVKNEKFEIPDEYFYNQLMDGSAIGAAGVDLLSKHGCSLGAAVAAVRSIFNRIAMPYSPHRAASIRRAELSAILKLCRLRQQEIPDGVAQ